ncbi:hypothetical protein DTO013E5_9180 [Penicillium roqueforti]|nr:hypothetical protein DTO012A1_8716 [Penicillium roqueforti]KAI2740248.1 hypothetical protein DTO013F2_9131 [Penicillium roqueforti]KAI2756324.1 hypothetical protein DTO006G1_7964 [Penicillium roqueforti]KAI2767194.1 hypothetical protein DTO012A8_7584 [Penicillium roqueforti]KAI3199909.1 hypothetical protein DTO013E5_9180 [Penicillium roqueforti]
MLATSANFTVSHATTTSDAYSSLLQGARTIYRTNGMRGFYRGLLPAMFGVVHGALQFMTYEKLKAFLRAQTVASNPQQATDHTKTLTMLDIAVASGLSRLFSGGLTYPYQVFRSRMQIVASQTDISPGFLRLTRTIWREEGIVALYRGMVPALFRVLSSTWLTLIIYEKAKTLLGGAEAI